MAVRTTSTAVALVAIALSLPLPKAGHAQGADSYPSKPIRFIVPFGAGGPGDAIGRMIGQKLGEGLGQTVVVDNRSGASTIIGTELAVKSPADGHTLLLISTTHAVNPSLFRKLPYDPLKDLQPVTMLADTPFMLVVHPSLPARSVAELVKLARSRPGQLNYGSSGNGSSIHLASELFKMAAKIDIRHVPYKGSGPAFIDLIGGHIQVLFSSSVSSLPHVNSGKLRGLGLTSAKRVAALPDMATLAETWPGFEASSWFGMMVPAGTPEPIVERLLRESRTALRSPEVNRALTGQGAEPGGNTPAEFGAFYRAEIRKWGAVITNAGIRLDQ
ncbi:MAG: tripartite tricarboxylate transporter substrate binding protein [bacterium]|jgi:tripartite-type tricarboxylate transporter receptor subunit TctC|nr:tripartite tricarboxylate transporter substrate binding protein [Betaproteobacteria bacterium]